MSATAQHHQPNSVEAAGAALARGCAAGRAVRIVGGATKLGWAPETDRATALSDGATEISTAALDGILEHNAGDLTAILQAGVPLAVAQQRFASEGQMLALDPPLGLPGQGAAGERATIGGIFASGDSGPLRHRYGAPRDLVLGMQVALGDGTLTRSGGKVIKNVAGYDIAKLMCGSFGTLGMILTVSVRLHPLPRRTVTVLGAAGNSATLADAALALNREPLELEALDVAWRGGRGGILARVAGIDPELRARRVAARMRELSLDGVDCVDRDSALWARQRAGQRARTGGALVRIASRPSRLAALLDASRAAGGTLVGRAGAAALYVELDPDAVKTLRATLAGSDHSVILDRPSGWQEPVFGSQAPSGALAALTRRVKECFDPSGLLGEAPIAGGG